MAGKGERGEGVRPKDTSPKLSSFQTSEAQTIIGKLLDYLLLMVSLVRHTCLCVACCSRPLLCSRSYFSLSSLYFSRMLLYSLCVVGMCGRHQNVCVHVYMLYMCAYMYYMLKEKHFC